jgi:hypothetical protein
MTPPNHLRPAPAFASLMARRAGKIFLPLCRKCDSAARRFKDGRRYTKFEMA